MAHGHLRGYVLLETEMASHWAQGVCLRAVVRDVESGHDLAISYRQWTNGPKAGQYDGYQQPIRVHAEVRSFRVWVED